MLQRSWRMVLPAVLVLGCAAMFAHAGSGAGVSKEAGDVAGLRHEVTAEVHGLR